MKYTKDGKIYELPILLEVEKEENGVVTKIKRYTTDKALILSAGYTEYVAPKQPLSVLIEQSDEAINAETDMKILNDFMWNGNEFYLSIENQFNFKNLYDLRNMKEYPVTIKTKNGFTTLENEKQVEEFYLEGVRFVETCIQEGWARKADAEASIRERFNKRKLGLYIIL